MDKPDDIGLNKLPDEMMVYVNVFRSFVVRRVGGKAYSRSIIIKQHHKGNINFKVKK